MPDVKFNCPHCDQHIEAPKELIGQTVECPTCHGRIDLQFKKPQQAQFRVPAQTPQRAPMLPPFGGNTELQDYIVKPQGIYQQHTLQFQHSSRKAIGSMLGRGIGPIISAILIGFITLVHLAATKNGLMGLFGGGITLAMFVPGLSMLFRVIFGKSRRIACPYCGAQYRLFTSARNYVCNTCGHPLRFQGDSDELVKTACPYCGLQWGASADSGETRCFSCGARVQVKGGAVKFNPNPAACPSCGGTNPEGSYVLLVLRSRPVHPGTSQRPGF